LQSIIFAITNINTLIFFFFFQAEDGIRDRNVTGVQTCALPISYALPAGKHFGAIAALAEAGVRRIRSGKAAATAGQSLARRRLRSEERRVGKECRSRGSRECLKKKWRGMGKVLVGEGSGVGREP